MMLNKCFVDERITQWAGRGFRRLVCPVCGISGQPGVTYVRVPHAHPPGRLMTRYDCLCLSCRAGWLEDVNFDTDEMVITEKV